MKKLALVIGLASLICLAGCGQSQTTTPTTTTTTTPTTTTPATKPTTTKPATPKISPKDVMIKNFQFSPTSTEITAGKSIQWINEDSAPHVIVADDGSFQSNSLGQGESFTHTFTQAGTYTYHCQIHPSMKGTIIVK